MNTLTASAYVFAIAVIGSGGAIAQEKPVFSLSAGYIYLNADQHTGNRASFNGWYAIPQYHLRSSWSVIGEVTGFYGSSTGKSTNIHSYTAGPVYSFSTGTRLTPFLFGELGDARTSAPGKITNALAAIFGLGLNVKMTDRVALQIVPGEYVLTAPSAGVLHNYAAQVGLAFNLK